MDALAEYSYTCQRDEPLLHLFLSLAPSFLSPSLSHSLFASSSCFFRFDPPFVVVVIVVVVTSDRFHALPAFLAFLGYRFAARARARILCARCVRPAASIIACVRCVSRFPPPPFPPSPPPRPPSTPCPRNLALDTFVFSIHRPTPLFHYLFTDLHRLSAPLNDPPVW